MALIIASIASMYVLQNRQHANFNEAVIELQKTVEYIITEGIINSEGYPNGRGDNCSENLDFKSLNDERLLNCLEWYDSDNNRQIKFDLENKTSNPKTNIIGNGLMENYGRCFVNVADNPTNTRQFDFFVDCSNVSFNDKSLEYIEDALQFTFVNTLNYILVNTDNDAISIDDTVLSGESDDGQIRARFEL